MATLKATKIDSIVAGYVLSRQLKHVKDAVIAIALESVKEEIGLIIAQYVFQCRKFSYALLALLYNFSLFFLCSSDVWFPLEVS